MTTLNRRIMGIKDISLRVFLFWNLVLWASNPYDSIMIDTKWSFWSISNISSDGDWISIYQIYPNDRKKNKAFVVDSDSKCTIEVTGISQHQFTNNDYLIGKKIGETIELDLTTNLKSSLGVLKQSDWIDKEQVFCYITKEKDLILKRYSKKKNKIIWTKKGITKYIMNPSKTVLLYQIEGRTELYLLDIKTLKEKSILNVNEFISSVTWNIQEDAFVFFYKKNGVFFVNLETGKNKTLKLPVSESLKSNLKVSFFMNKDFIISYKILNQENNSVEAYVDIWNGNDRDLKNKEQPKSKGVVKTLFYSQSIGELTVLPGGDKREYLNMGVNNYLLVYDPFELRDYTDTNEIIRYRLFELTEMEEKEVLTVMTPYRNIINIAPNGVNILYPKRDLWEVYNFERKERYFIPHRDVFSRPVWSSDSKSVFYIDGENIIRFDCESNQHQKLSNLKGKSRFSIINVIEKRHSLYVDITGPVYFNIRHDNEKTSYVRWYKDSLTKMVDSSSNKLNYFYLPKGVSMDGKTVVWTEENYNQPSNVKVYRKGTVKTLLESDIPKELYAWRKQKVIHYKDKYGIDLAGVLWYPKEFDSNKKYPMISWVYERQQHSRSIFDIPTLYNMAGFNRSLLNEQGYFVFQPDTYVSEEGAGLSALECVTKGIEAVTVVEPSIDKTKLGLMGHSFGGYETSFILSKTNLFKAGISGAGIHNLIYFNYDYNYQLKRPNYFRVEGPQIDLRVSFGENPEKYYKNSPIHFSQDYETPVLLWTGLKDMNVPWENTRQMYIALQRYKKPVIALFYKSEGHSLSNRTEQFDLTHRVLDWFDYYLKDKKTVGWISKGIDYNQY